MCKIKLWKFWTKVDPEKVNVVAEPEKIDVAEEPKKVQGTNIKFSADDSSFTRAGNIWKALGFCNDGMNAIPQIAGWLSMYKEWDDNKKQPPNDLLKQVAKIVRETNLPEEVKDSRHLSHLQRGAGYLRQHILYELGKLRSDDNDKTI